jgi:hypothetical protein
MIPVLVEHVGCGCCFLLYLMPMHMLVFANEIKIFRSMVKERLHDAMVSLIFMCGMTPLDLDDPCYDDLHCDPTLDCTTHIEADFYTCKIQFARVELCCHCAGEFESPVEMNTSLRATEGPYYVVLPICQACLENGFLYHCARG